MSRYHKNKHLSKKQKGFGVLDYAVLSAAIIEPTFVIPQIIAIFSSQDASGVSITTWLGFELMTAIWFIYAIVNKQKMILVSSGLFLIAQGLVIVGAILYGGSW